MIDWKGYVLEKAYNAMAADPKGLIPFLFHKYGRELDRKSYEAFDVVTYKVPESPAFSIADSFEALAVNFGDELMLTEMAFGGSSLQDTSTPQEVERRELPSGKSGWVVLRWQVFDGFGRSAALERANLQRRIARIEYEQALRDARSEIDQAERAVNSARGQVEATRTAANAAEAARELMRRRFDQGLSTAADLLQAEARATAMRDRAIGALERCPCVCDALPDLLLNRRGLAGNHLGDQHRRARR